MEEKGRKRRRITPKEKLEIFMETQKGEVSKAEVARRHGIHPAEISRIERKAKEALLEGFKNDRRKRDSQKQELVKEVERLKEALTEQSVEVTLLRKKVNGA